MRVRGCSAVNKRESGIEIRRKRKRKKEISLCILNMSVKKFGNTLKKRKIDSKEREKKGRENERKRREREHKEKDRERDKQELKHILSCLIKYLETTYRMRKIDSKERTRESN